MLLANPSARIPQLCCVAYDFSISNDGSAALDPAEGNLMGLRDALANRDAACVGVAGGRAVRIDDDSNVVRAVDPDE